MPLRGEVRRHASLSGARAAADGSQLFTAFSNNQARDDDDDAARLCGFVCAAAPRAGNGRARRHHIPPDLREGGLRLPKNFLKKKKGCRR